MLSWNAWHCPPPKQLIICMIYIRTTVYSPLASKMRLSHALRLHLPQAGWIFCYLRARSLWINGAQSPRNMLRLNYLCMLTFTYVPANVARCSKRASLAAALATLQCIMCCLNVRSAGFAAPANALSINCICICCCAM